LGAAVSTAAAVVLLRLWTADLRVPFDYGGDALSFSLVVKSVVDNGWYLTNSHVGAPFGLEMHDFPFADSLHLVLIKVMACFTSDWALLFNVYFLLGFPLITMSAMAVFRHYRLPYGVALMASVLYAFLPSRLLKGEGHIFMDVFFQVPLAILVTLWVCEEQPPLAGDRGGHWPGLELRRGRSVAAVLICLATSCTGLYYAFFAAFLLVAAGVWASLRRRTFRHVLSGALLASIIAVGLAVNGLPTTLYRARHGPNPDVAVRQSADSELFGLKPVQLVLPVDGHRLGPLARFKQQYVSSRPLTGETGSSLGVVGTVGLLALLGSMLLGGPREQPRAELFRALAVLNMLALLLGVVGGLGSLFALLVTPQIRTYARVNVVIGFLALFAVALLLERLGRRRQKLAGVVAAFVLGLGLLDQATANAVRPYAAVKVAYRSDANLVGRIEATVPRGAMIFQLPHQSFPEAPLLHQMDGYDAIRPYLHARFLRWSQPTMRGRTGDAWLTIVAGREPGRLVETISAAGFEGILIDRNGYEDGGVQLETALAPILAVEPIVGTTGRMSFFPLGSFNQAAQAGMTAREQERRRDLALHPLLVFWRGGFSEPEGVPGRTWRWCSATGELVIENGSRSDGQLSIRMTLAAANPPASLQIDGDLTSSRVELGPKGAPLSLTLRVTPGRHVIRFRSDGKAADAPGDPRTLIWRAEDPIVEEMPRPDTTN
jgi:phosphoglycerol transferase